MRAAWGSLILLVSFGVGASPGSPGPAEDTCADATPRAAEPYQESTEGEAASACASSEPSASSQAGALLQKRVNKSREVVLAADEFFTQTWAAIVQVVVPVVEDAVDEVDEVVQETVQATASVGAAVLEVGQDAVATGAAWALGAIVNEAQQWTAGVLFLGSTVSWNEQANKNAVRWGSTASGDIAGWTDGVCEDVVQWSVQATQDASRWSEDAVEDIQEFAEEVGDFISSALHDAKQWVLEFLKQAAAGVQKAMKEGFQLVAVCTGMQDFPEISLASVTNSPCFEQIRLVAESIVATVRDLTSVVNRLGNVFSNMMSDGDMYKAIFGLVGEQAVNSMESLIALDLPSLAMTTGDVAQTYIKVNEIMTTYFRKHASAYASEILPVINDAVRRVRRSSDTIIRTFSDFIGGLSLVQLDSSSNSSAGDAAGHAAARRLQEQKLAAIQKAFGGWERKTWYVALCGGGAYSYIGIGGCIYYPFMLGEFPEPNMMTFEFGVGFQAEVVGWEIEGGIKFGPILTNDLTSMAGLSTTGGVDLDLGASGGLQGALDVSMTHGEEDGNMVPGGLEPLISLDFLGGIGTGLNKAAAFGADFGDISPFYSAQFAVPLLPIPDQEMILYDGLDATDNGAAGDDSLFRKELFLGLLATGAGSNSSAVATADTSAGASAGAARRASSSKVAAAVSSASGLGNSLADRRYAVFNGPCLPGAAVMTAKECKYAYEKLNRRGIFEKTSVRGLQIGAWNGVPWACSIWWRNDWDPHFNTNAETDSARGANGEFRSICRRLYRLGPRNQPTCPPGSAITTNRECSEAYTELQHYFDKEPKRGLVQGAWDGVPNWCSVQERHDSDQSPHWNTLGSSSGSRATDGEFRVLCKPRRFWTEDAETALCPYGSAILTSLECQVAYNALQSRFPFPAKRGLIRLHEDRVPTGCSTQYRGVPDDMSPHFNTMLSDNSRSTSGEFINLCKEPSYWMATSTACPKGLEINDAFTCKAAYEALRHNFAFISKRGLQVGNWAGVPDGCSVQKAGSYVTDNSDASPHFNTNLQSDRSRSKTGEFRPLCVPGRYFMPPAGARRCPAGTGITTQQECEHAYNAFGHRLQYPAKRGMITGRSWRVPYQCSLQYQGPYVDMYKDQTVFYNYWSRAHGYGGFLKRFVPICKASD